LQAVPATGEKLRQSAITCGQINCVVIVLQEKIAEKELTVGFFRVISNNKYKKKCKGVS